jgi:p-methyltransferase
MAPQSIEALFIPYYQDMNRWYNDVPGQNRPLSKMSAAHGSDMDFVRASRMARESVRIDGNLYDFSRFLSWVRYGSTLEYERYDSYSLTLLAGSYYLSFLRRHGVNLHVANTVNRESLEMLGQQYEPRFVLFSTTLLLEHLLVHEAIAHVRRIWPEAIVVLGGLFLVETQKTASREEFHNVLRGYNADAYVISAQGEIPLLEILKRGSRQALFADPNIPSTYLVSDGVVYEPPSTPEPVLPMEENYLRWHSVIPQEHLYHTVHTRTARSCAFKCAFCNFPVLQGALTLMPVEVFEKELQELQACGRVRSLIFTDDTFNVPPVRFKELCKVLAKYDFEWYSFFRAQYADEETAQLMQAAHCKGVFLGIESADDEVLMNMNKSAKIATIRRGVAQLKEHDIRTHANFIIGYPGDTEEKARKIIPFLDDMEIDFCTLVPWYYDLATPIAQRKEEFGLEGAWWNWKHNTMNSKEAFALAEELMKEPKYSVHAPELSANEFWSEIMLYCNGFTRDEAQLAFQTFNLYRGRNVPAAEIQRAPSYAKLRSVLLRREMPIPKNF